jgi:hypothetical protein
MTQTEFDRRVQADINALIARGASMHPNDPNNCELGRDAIYAAEYARLMDCAKAGKLSDELQEVACNIFDRCAKGFADIEQFRKITDSEMATLGWVFIKDMQSAIAASAKREMNK